MQAIFVCVDQETRGQTFGALPTEFWLTGGAESKSNNSNAVNWVFMFFWVR